MMYGGHLTNNGIAIANVLGRKEGWKRIKLLTGAGVNSFSNSFSKE